MRLLISYLVPIIAIICAAILAYHGVEGWGWFLFIAALAGSADSIQSKMKKNAS